MDSHNFDLYGDSSSYFEHNGDDSHNGKFSFLGRLGLGALSLITASEATWAAVNVITNHTSHHQVNYIVSITEGITSSAFAYLAVAGKLPRRSR